MNPDLILLTETWLKPETPNSFFDCYRDYQIYRKDRPGETKGGGVAILAKNGMICSEMFLPHGFSNSDVLILRVKCKAGLDTIIVNWYRPNVTNVDALEILESTLRNLSTYSCPVIFAGDLNLPGVDWTNLYASPTHSQDKFLQKFCEYGYAQKVEENTRGENILDVVLCNEPNLIMNVAVSAPLANSDHSVVQFQIKTDVCFKANDDQPKRDWAKANFLGIAVELELTNWNSLFANKDVDEMYTTFLEKCTEFCEVFVPFKRPMPKNSKSLRPKEVKKLHRKKLAAYKRKKITPTTANKQKFKNFSSLYKTAVLEHSLSRERKILSNANQKSFFRFVNSKLVAKPGVASLTHNGVLHNSDAEKADILNNQFSSVFVVDNGNALNPGKI